MFLTLLLLAIPVACASWTITETEVFRDFREALKAWACKRPNSRLCQKIAYLVTCYYCTSHYVSAFFLVLCPLNLYDEEWRGYIPTWFTLIGVTAVYLTAFHLGRTVLRGRRAISDLAELRRDEFRLRTESRSRARKRKLSHAEP